jgi:hypothetical protein
MAQAYPGNKPHHPWQRKESKKRRRVFSEVQSRRQHPKSLNKLIKEKDSLAISTFPTLLLMSR